jgi:DsbC/DsbD-like thiol-disulfide interchange protein
MMFRSKWQQRCLALVACGTALLPAGLDGAWGEDASRWDGDARSAARLITGVPAQDGTAILRAGIEIRIKSGWHTYWRYPGDAGVPPTIDFNRSENVQSIDVAWPAPHRMVENGLATIGYDRDVVLPLHIMPQTAGKPVVLRLKLDYAICEKLCVPAAAQVAVAVGGTATHESTLAAAEALVPKRRPLGDAAGLAIRALHRDNSQMPPRILVDVAAPAGAHIDLFAEGPTPEWALPLPIRLAGAPPGLLRFAFELDGAPPGEGYDGITVKLTAVSGGEAIEVLAGLD